ncbi:GntR family transcriptional regulator [Streptomyces sp. NPDC102364]|uniref:GntR family transcriptional regulator n=1 Tax=Streptomyces sp. NPDC102364 TaxID=3366161 RepID=UPI0037F8C875
MAQPAAIDRQASTPYYQQLGGILEQRLADGTIEAGSRLPSEQELGSEFGLSRATVRQALNLLESRALVTRITGRGVYATEPSTGQGWVIQEREGFLENAIGHQNRSVTTEVLRHGPTILPPSVCRALEVQENAAGYEMVRLRSLDNTPALYSVNYSPADLVPAIAAMTEVLEGRASFSEALDVAGYSLGGAHRSIRAVAPSPEVAKALDITPATPALHIRSTSWTPQGKRFDVYDTWVRSDVVPLEINVDATAHS